MPSRLISWLHLLWVQTGILLAVLLSLEGVARLYLRLAPGLQGNPARSIKPLKLDEGEKQPAWMDAYIKEAARLPPPRWHPFAYWIGAPFHGQFFNIDSEGLRATWSPPPQTCTRRQRLFVFGGSTVWGVYARDDYTLPSLLAKLLDDPCVEVTNFGQPGYVSSQEVILLQEQLKKGKVPDVAIFYDGVNDPLAAMENQRAGVSEQELWLAQDFSASGLSRLMVWAARHCALAKVVRMMFRSADYSRFIRMRQEMQKNLGLPSESEDQWKPGIIEDYSANVKIVRALARDFGFRTVFFWQPVIWSKQPSTPREARVEEETELMLPGIGELYREVYRQLSARSREEEIVDLASVLDGNQRYFIDFCHVTEDGSRKVAEAMLPELKRALEHPGG